MNPIFAALIGAVIAGAGAGIFCFRFGRKKGYSHGWDEHKAQKEAEDKATLGTAEERAKRIIEEGEHNAENKKK